MSVTREQIQQARRNKESVGFTSPPRMAFSQPSEPNEVFPRVRETDVLFEDLGGKLPGKPGWFGETSPIASAEQTMEERSKRRIATALLTKRGYSNADIEAILKIRKQLTPTSQQLLTREAAKGIGAAVGAGIAEGVGKLGPLAAAPEEFITRPLAASVGAFAGGMLGEAGYRGLAEGRLATPQELLGAGAEEASFEAGGRLGFSALKKGIRYTPLTRKPNEEAAQLVAKYGALSQAFSPAELDNRITVHIGEAISRGSFGTKSLWDELPGRVDDATDLIAKHLREHITKGIAIQSPDEVGRILHEAIRDKEGFIVSRIDDYFGPLYRQADELTQFRYEPIFAESSDINVYKTVSGSKKGLTEDDIMKLGDRWVDKITAEDVIIDPDASGSGIRKIIGKEVVGTGVKTDSIKAIARQELEVHGRMMKQGKAGKGLYLSSQGEGLLRSIIDLEDEIGFGDMWKLKTRFQIEARKLARDIDASQSLVKRLSSAALDSMNDPALVKNLPDEAKNLIENTNRLYKSASQDLKLHFSESLSKKLLNKPSKVVREVFPQDNPELIRDFKRSLISPIAGQSDPQGELLWRQLKQAWVANLLEESMTSTGLKHTQYFNRMKKMGRSMEAMFSNDEITTLNDIGKTLRISKLGSPAGTGLFTKGIQIGGAATLWQGYKSDNKVAMLAGGALVLGPLGYAKLALSPGGRRVLVMGLNVRPGSKQAIANTVRVINALKDIEQEEMSIRQKAQKQKEWRAAQSKVRQDFWYAGP